METEDDQVTSIIAARYESQPRWEEICRMSRKEVERVEGFTVENRHAKITFLGETDLSGMDIDKLSKLSIIW